MAINSNANSPSTGTESDHLDGKAIIGIALAAAILVGFLLLVFGLFCRRKRQISSSSVELALSNDSIDSQATVIPLSSIREIGHNSLIGPVRELPDSDKAELRTHRSTVDGLLHPAHRKADALAMQTPKSCRSEAVSFAIDRPAIEKPMASWEQPKALDALKIRSLPKRGLSLPNTRTLPNLNRSLPPTPISESPMPVRNSSLYRWLAEVFPERDIPKLTKALGICDRRLSDFARNEAHERTRDESPDSNPYLTDPCW